MTWNNETKSIATWENEVRGDKVTQTWGNTLLTWKENLREWADPYLLTDWTEENKNTTTWQQ